MDVLADGLRIDLVPGLGQYQSDYPLTEARVGRAENHGVRGLRGRPSSAASTSSGKTFSPPELMQSEPRPRTTMLLSAFTVARSPGSAQRWPRASTKVAVDPGGSPR